MLYNLLICMCTFLVQEVGALGEILRAHGQSPGDHGQARQGEQRRPRGGPSQVAIPTHHKQSQSISIHRIQFQFIHQRGVQYT
jgi:hypothetical protein